MTDAPKNIELRIAIDPGTGRIRLSGPLQRPDICFAMLQEALTQVFGLAAKGEDEEARAVKTLDELGVNRIRRVK